MAANPTLGETHPFSGTFSTWFERLTPSVAVNDYRHHHFAEVDDSWSQVAEPVCEFFLHAHDDAIRNIERLVGPSLHPAGIPVAIANGYPHALPPVTLQGYFGEVLAGMFAEHGAPGGQHDWEVPAFLFRTHLVAFQQLERDAQTGDMPTAIPGRTGDDCLAFRRDSDGRIIALLFCEAKCTLDHDAQLIADAHAKASAGAVVDILQVIDVLLAQGTPEAIAWVDALRILRDQLRDERTTVTRHDAVVYVHQRAPIRDPSWMSPERPHEQYTARRSLDAFEIRLPNVSARIQAVYSAEVWQ